MGQDVPLILELHPSSVLKTNLTICFHDFYFFFGQTVEFVDEFVNLFVGGVDLSLDSRFVGGDFSFGQLFV